MKLSVKEKEVLLKAIAALDGESKVEFLELREDLELTAVVHEARHHPSVSHALQQAVTSHLLSHMIHYPWQLVIPGKSLFCSDANIIST